MARVPASRTGTARTVLSRPRACLTVRRIRVKLSWFDWGRGAAGSALDWQSRGRGFNSRRLHFRIDDFRLAIDE